MKSPIAIFSSVLALTIASTAVAVAAAPRAQSATVASRGRVASFAIANMTCATCPITVKTAMSAVPGVQTVKVNFESKTAIVRFDPRLTNAASIAAASTNAGYPARPRG